MLYSYVTAEKDTHKTFVSWLRNWACVLYNSATLVAVDLKISISIRSNDCHSIRIDASLIKLHAPQASF